MNYIPLCDLHQQYGMIREEVLAVIDKICQDSSFIKGSHLYEFEKTFKQMHESLYGVGCSNGTTAISLALEALGINRGDEVILPSHTFMATAEAVCHVGAIPVFADIKPSDYTIDPDDIAHRITSKAKAIIPVHIYGTPCDMNDIIKIAGNYNLKIIEDAAQAHFAQYSGKYVGNFGDAATFSFYPGKNLGAYGDAGFIFCKTSETEEYIKRLIDHGRLEKHDHKIIGYNHRMDSIQAAVLSVKLKYIDKWTKRRKEIGKKFDAFLKPNGFKVIEYDSIKEPVYHVYNVEVSNRQEVQHYLKEKGIQTGIHYPVPVHRQEAFSRFSFSNLPVTESISGRILSLPVYPEMLDEQVHRVCENFLQIAKA